MKKRVLLSILSLVFLLGGVGNVYGGASLSEDVQSIYNLNIGSRSRNIHQFMLKVTAVLKKVDSNKKMEAMEAFLVGGALKLYLEKMNDKSGLHDDESDLHLVNDFVNTIAPPGGIGDVYGGTSMSRDVQYIYYLKDIKTKSEEIQQLMSKVKTALKNMNSEMNSKKKMEAMEAFLVGGALRLYLENMGDENDLRLVKSFVDTIAPWHVTDEAYIKNYIEKKLKSEFYDGSILEVFKEVLKKDLDKTEKVATAKYIIKRDDFKKEFSSYKYNYKILEAVLSYDSTSKNIKLDKKNRTVIAKLILEDEYLIGEIEDKIFGSVFKMAAVGGFKDICDLILNGKLRSKLKTYVEKFFGIPGILPPYPPDSPYFSYFLNDVVAGPGASERILKKIGLLRESLHQSILENEIEVKITEGVDDLPSYITNITKYRGREETFKFFSSTEDKNNVYQLNSLISVAKLIIEDEEFIKTLKENFRHYMSQISNGWCFKILKLIFELVPKHKELSQKLWVIPRIGILSDILYKLEKAGNKEFVGLIKKRSEAAKKEIEKQKLAKEKKKKDARKKDYDREVGAREDSFLKRNKVFISMVKNKEKRTEKNLKIILDGLLDELFKEMFEEVSEGAAANPIKVLYLIHAKEEILPNYLKKVEKDKRSAYVENQIEQIREMGKDDGEVKSNWTKFFFWGTGIKKRLKMLLDLAKINLDYDLERLEEKFEAKKE